MGPQKMRAKPTLKRSAAKAPPPLSSLGVPDLSQMRDQIFLPTLSKFPPRSGKAPWGLFLRKLRNPKRAKKWGQMLTLVFGIVSAFGFPISQLVSVTWILIAVLLASILLGLFFIWLPADELDTYHGKAKVDWAWDEMLRSAKESITVVAGDLSWLDDDRSIDQTLAVQCAGGLPVRVISKAPGLEPDLRREIVFLISIGAQVRVLPEHLRPLPYTGIVIDRERPEDCTAFRNRTIKNQGELGEEKIEKWGRRYLSTRDAEQMAMWLPLVEAYWECSSPVTILEPLPRDSETSALLLKALRLVPLYSSLKNTDFQIVHVDIRTLFSWCLREDKLASLAPVMGQMNAQKICTFEPCACWTNKDQTILIPPIVERHGEMLVVVEGTHRLWYLHRADPMCRAQVIMIENQGPLPGEPVPFSEMRTYPGRVDRPAVIRNYDVRYWRSFTPMENFLQGVSRKRLGARMGEMGL